MQALWSLARAVPRVRDKGCLEVDDAEVGVVAQRDATLAAGARIVAYDRATESREEIGARLAAESGAAIAARCGYADYSVVDKVFAIARPPAV